MKSFSNYIINSNAIRHNFKQCKKLLTGTKICVVVKANAYGIGANVVVKQLDDLTDYYAVACFLEAERLRELTDKPILTLNFVDISQIDFCVKNYISITIASLFQLQKVIKFLNNKNEAQKEIIKSYGGLKIHFAINTGMNRIGFNSINEFYQSVILLKKCSYLQLEGIFTHFYYAESLRDTEQQNRIFMQYLNLLKLHFDMSKIIVHAANSIAALRYKKYNYDMVRLGIVLYGGLKLKAKNNYSLNFKDVVSIKSKIIAVRKIKRGDAVGYNKSFVAKKDMTIATIPLGYADGIFREFALKGKVLISGKKCKVVGNICMDMFMVDISNIEAKIFDEVVLIGNDKFGNCITLLEFANFCNTISYEVLTNVKRSRFNVKFE